MKPFIIITLLLTALFSSETRTEQIKRLESLIDTLATPYNLNLTVKAIAWVESNMGQYNVNIGDPSCGITHIHLKFFMKAHEIKDTSFNRNLTCQKLLDNDELAIAAAIENLLYWKSIFCKNKVCTNAQYQKVVKAYNVGFNINSAKATEYWKKVQREIKIQQGLIPEPKDRRR